MPHRAAEWFSQAALERSWQALPDESNQQVAAPSLHKLQGSPADMACFAWRCPSHTRLAHLAHIKVAVPFLQPDSPEAVATFAALILLMDRLKHMTSLHTLSLSMVDRDGVHRRAVRRGPVQYTPQHAALWASLLKALRELVQACPYIRRIELATPPGLLLHDQVVQLQSSLQDVTSRDALRLAFLRGTHRNAGTGCLIRRLPVPVLEAILDLALPKQPCVFAWDVLMWHAGLNLPALSSSDSDDSDDDGSSDTSGDTSGSEEALAPDLQAIACWL